MSQGIKQVLCIPVQGEHLQARLMVCAHMGGRCHRGKVSALHAVRPCCVWNPMEADVVKFVRKSLHCLDSKLVELKPRPLGKLIHSDGVGEVKSSTSEPVGH